MNDKQRLPTSCMVVVAFFAAIGIFLGLFLLRQEGFFFDRSSVQAVSPDGAIKAMLVNGNSTRKHWEDPPFNQLRMEIRDLSRKPSFREKSTKGYFTQLKWLNARELQVTGKNLERELTSVGMEGPIWRLGTFRIRFVEEAR